MRFLGNPVLYVLLSGALQTIAIMMRNSFRGTIITRLFTRNSLYGNRKKYKTKANGNILKIRTMTLRGPGLTAIPSIRPIIGRTSGIRLRRRMEISSNHPKTDGVGRKRLCSKKWKRGKFISTQIRQI